jgi:hypothetical protein
MRTEAPVQSAWKLIMAAGVVLFALGAVLRWGARAVSVAPGCPRVSP